MYRANYSYNILNLLITFLNLVDYILNLQADDRNIKSVRRQATSENAKRVERNMLAFSLDQFADSFTAASNEASNGDQRAFGAGAFRTQRKKRDIFNRLRTLMRSGPVMNAEQARKINIEALQSLKPIERQAFYRCDT